MIDLIIPYYNNPDGLTRTLESIVCPELFYITVVDDCSDVHMPASPTKVNQVLRYNKNRGPGYARQWGIDKTSNEWIMFIDTGDVFLSRESFDEIVKAIENNSEANIISFSYIYNDRIENEQSNRMHGKIYKRDFLEHYNITFAVSGKYLNEVFAAESSYMNEDIGFNRTCRLCTNIDTHPIAYIDTPTIKWIEEENSLTSEDNHVRLYRNQTCALSFNEIHTIETCRANGINVEEEINQIAIALYYWFIRAAAERPTYLQSAWNGAQYFYKYFQKDIDPNKLLLGNAYMKKCLLYRNKISFPVNILRFADEIQKYEIVPSKYLT